MRIQSVTRTTRSHSLPNALETELITFDRSRILDPHVEEESSVTSPPEEEEKEAGTRSDATTVEHGPVKEQAQEQGLAKTSTTLEIPSACSSYDVNYNSIPASDVSLFPNGVTMATDLDANTMMTVARRGRQFGESQTTKKVRRLVQKNGHSNVTITKASRKKRRFIRDFFTTIMDMRLRYHIVLFISGFIVSWLLFALGWMAIAYSNGDIPMVESDNTTDICLINVYDFNTALLFSIEMQTTVGFGFRLIGQHCPIATILMMAQSIVGIFITCFITGIIFAKIARPLRRARTIVFSHNAVICVRDGFYNLIFRVGDLRKTHIIGTSIRALLIRSRQTSEGELIPLCQYPLDLITESSITDSFVFFFWPVTVAHRITESSPLWNLSAESILTDQFEVIVILEGTAQTSGALIQIKTSYIPNEIRWGQRLTPLLTTQRDDGEYEIDYSNFHDTTPVVMPDWSASEYARRMAHGHPEAAEHENNPSIFVENEDQHSFRLALNNARHHSRLPWHIKIPKHSKESRHKGRAEVKNPEPEVQQPPEVTGQTGVIPPPPTYESLGGPDCRDAGSPVTIRIEGEEGTSAMDGNPDGLRTDGKTNHAYNSSNL